MKLTLTLILASFFLFSGISNVNYTPETGVYFQNAVYAKGKKTVRVKSYTTKKGKVVKSHTRSKPRRR